MTETTTPASTGRGSRPGGAAAHAPRHNGGRQGTGDLAPAVLEGRWRTVAAVGLVLVVVAGVVLRFWTKSALWLDEALTVDIARLPVHQIPSYLKRDGAPPLYYVLLHFWMGVFGQSDVAVRALSGLLSVATLPVAWVAGRRLGGRSTAWVTLAVLASAPFAVYYATESRMYALVMFLTACGLVALQRLLERPRPGNVAALTVVAAALLYSQYWAVYLLGALGLWLLWQLWRAPSPRKENARWALGSVVLGGVLFLPWVPTFLYQAKHTGTPWAAPPNFAAVINAVTGFTDNQATLTTAGSNQGRLLALCYFILIGLAVFGVARDRWHVDLDVRTRPPARGLAFVILVTLLAAITGGILSGSAFSPRYASVVFVPLLVVVAYGARALADAYVRLALVAVVAVAGLATGVENVWTQRTQAPGVAAVIQAHARPGDLVVFCPDQLGPPVYRLLQGGQTSVTGQVGRYTMITYPRGIGPAFVDWVTYKQAAQSSNAAAFARELEAKAGNTHDIWLVSAPGYQGFGTKCQMLAADLLGAPGYGGHQWVSTNPARYYEPMNLTQFAPPATAPPASTGP